MAASPLASINTHLQRGLVAGTIGCRALIAENTELPRDGSKILLKVTLYMNKYPLVICPAPNAPLRITDLHLTSHALRPPIGYYYPILCASAATLTELSMVDDHMK